MATHNPNGGRNIAVPDENQPSWRPQDESAGHQFGRRDDDERDERAWQDRRFTDDDRSRRYGDRYGAGSGGGYTYRGHAGGRYGDERLHELQRRRDDPMSAGSFEDNRRLGVDERSGGHGYWQDRGADVDRQARGSYRGRDFEPERRGLSRGYEERMGYPTGSGRGDERMGYAAGSYRHSGTQDAHRDPGTEGHFHRGTGPHRGKGPTGYQRSDERIRELVCESLTDDDQIDASHIEVNVKNGEVTLTGSVENRHAKRDAEDCACSISGVRDVQNLLRVQPDDGRGNRSTTGSVGKFETETPAQDRKARA